jgi:Presenilin
VLALFVWPAPMTLKQMYLTITGVIVAYVFTWTPEWTTWALLVAMAIYDIFAVLMPGGPLKVWPHAAIQLEPDLWHLLRLPAICEESRLRGQPCRGLQELVQIAEERQVDIPALVYEARPVNNITVIYQQSAHCASSTPPGPTAIGSRRICRCR